MFLCHISVLIKKLFLKRQLDFEDDKSNAIEKDRISQRLEEIYKRLQLIDADSAEARAAAILAVSCFFAASLTINFS